MTPRERVRTAFRHEQPDIVPWEIALTEPMRMRIADQYGDPRLADEDFFTTWIGNHCRYLYPISRGQFHGLEEEVEPGHWRDGWGIVWDTRGLHGEGEWGRPVNCALPEPTLKGYTFPDPPGEEAFAHYEMQLAQYRETFTIANEGHLFEVAWALRGMENFLTDLSVNPGFVEDLLDGITDYYLALIDRSIDYDFDAFTFGEDWGSQHMGLIMGPRHWRHFIKPRLAKMFERVKAAGKFVHLHSDGQVTDVFEDLIEIGLDIYNPFQPEIMDVFEMKRLYGDRLSFHGGIGVQSVLPFGTPEQVADNVQEMIERVGAGGGYLLSQTHPEGIMDDVPVENVVALLETVRGQE